MIIVSIVCSTLSVTHSFVSVEALGGHVELNSPDKNYLVWCEEDEPIYTYNKEIKIRNQRHT